jgi:hypothetical protein
MENIRSITPNDPDNFTPVLGNYKTLQPFRYWCQKVLPLVYDDSLSYYEVLCKVVDYINNLIENDKAMVKELNKQGADISELKTLVDDIQKELTAILNGEAEGLYINALKQYIDNNLEGIVGRVVKFVNFGLSADGYFTALIPSTWEFISFDTIVDTESELYGHLILNW